MPATGLKIVGAHLYHCLSLPSPLLLKNSLKTSGHRGYELCNMSIWNLEVCGHLWHFLFNDAPNFLYRWKIWTAGSQLSTRALLLQSHAVVIAAVCGVALSCWNTRSLEWSIHCSKTFIHLSAFIVLSKTFKLPIPYELMHPHTSEMLAFELNADEMLEGLPLL